MMVSIGTGSWKMPAQSQQKDTIITFMDFVSVSLLLPLTRLFSIENKVTKTNKKKVTKNFF